MWSTSAGTVSPERMLPKTTPLPGGRGCRMRPVRAPEWSPCPFTSTLRAIVRCRKRRAGASGTERAPAVGRLEHLVALVAQHAAQRVADVLLVVHHQDRLRHPASSPPVSGPGNRPALRAHRELRGTAPNGKLHHEATPTREVVPHADESVVVGDDRRHDGEPEAGAAGLGREVGLEDYGFHLVVQA